MEPASFTRWRLDMRRSTLWMCALLAIATSGCEQIKSQYTKIKDTIVAKIAERRGRAPAAPAQPAPAQATPETPAPQPAPATPPAKPPRRPAIQAPEISRPTRDTPYDSPNTGTIDPGMSEKDVYSMWGPPVGVRRQADKPSKNEEEYFARRDAELLRQQREAMRRTAAETERRAHHMKCPKCGYDLITGEWHGVQIDQCTHCHGIWFDKGEAESLLAHPSPNMITRVFRIVMRGVSDRKSVV